MKGEAIRKRKTRKLMCGIGVIAGGILLAGVEMYLPFLEVKGVLAVLVAVPCVWIGSSMCYRATHVQPADILNLAEEMNGQITPQAVIKAFDCKPTEAEKCLNNMCDRNLIRLAQEAIDSGEYIYVTSVSANPSAEASARSKELDKLLERAGISPTTAETRNPKPNQSKQEKRAE